MTHVSHMANASHRSFDRSCYGIIWQVEFGRESGVARMIITLPRYFQRKIRVTRVDLIPEGGQSPISASFPRHVRSIAVGEQGRLKVENTRSHRGELRPN